VFLLGYGFSDGQVGHDPPLRAVEAAYHHLVDDLDIDPLSIILYGKSLGSCPTTHLAHYLSTSSTLYPPSGVILQSPLAVYSL